MDIILLERVENLGQMGDLVKVRPGYARNYLLPTRKALRATKSNLTYFEKQRAQLETTNLKKRDEAQKAGAKVDGVRVILIRQAGDSGQLYGSVSARDVAESLAEEGFTVDRAQVQIDRPIKSLGLFDVRVNLHPEVHVTVTVNVARSKDEAELQAQHGGMVTRDDMEAEEAAQSQSQSQQTEAEAGEETTGEETAA